VANIGSKNQNGRLNLTFGRITAGKKVMLFYHDIVHFVASAKRGTTREGEQWAGQAFSVCATSGILWRGYFRIFLTPS